MLGKYYKLDSDNQPVEVTWLEWLRTGRGHVAKTERDSVLVSTVFWGVDHGEGRLWETMVFGGEHNEYQRRYSSHHEAILGHQQACEMCWGKDFILERHTKTRKSP